MINDRKNYSNDKIHRAMLFLATIQKSLRTEIHLKASGNRGRYRH